MQVGEGDFFALEAQRVVAVLNCLEADGDFAHVSNVERGKVMALLLEVDLGAAVEDFYLGQLLTILEVDDGAVDEGGRAGLQVEDQFGPELEGGGGAEGHGLTVFFGDDEDAFHGIDGFGGTGGD